MENNSSNHDKNGVFSTLYRTRIIITKGESVIVNLSILFSLIALLVAPWLVIIGALVALLLGYRFSISRNASGFTSDFGHIVRDAANNVKNVVENAAGSHEKTPPQENDDPNHQA